MRGAAVLPKHCEVTRRCVSTESASGDMSRTAKIESRSWHPPFTPFYSRGRIRQHIPPPQTFQASLIFNTERNIEVFQRPSMHALITKWLRLHTAFAELHKLVAEGS